MGHTQAEVSFDLHRSSLPYTDVHSEQSPDFRAELNEHNLYYYITKGPNQLKRGLDSPMLELAHERQFAISQLGTRSVGFEVEHSARVTDALQFMHQCFEDHQIRDACGPSSPNSADLLDLRIQSRCYSPLPALELSHQSLPISSPTSSVTGVERSIRSSLPLKELMNPAPSTPPTLKRKASSGAIATMLVDSESEEEHHIENDTSLDLAPAIKYSRANYIRSEGASTRTHRDVRMRNRKTRPLAMHTSVGGSYDADQIEKDGQLLLNLSQSRMAI